MNVRDCFGAPSKHMVKSTFMQKQQVLPMWRKQEVSCTTNELACYLVLSHLSILKFVFVNWLRGQVGGFNSIILCNSGCKLLGMRSQWDVSYLFTHIDKHFLVEDKIQQ